MKIQISTKNMLLTVSEEQRRFGEMMKLYGMGGDMPAPDGELILNAACPMIRRLADKPDETVVRHLYMLAVLGQRTLTAEELREFLASSYGVLEKMV